MFSSLGVESSFNTKMKGIVKGYFIILLKIYFNEEILKNEFVYPPPPHIIRMEGKK